MKVLSVRQPYAWMLVNSFAGKCIENRDWFTAFRGPLLIHAGSRFDPFALDWIWERLTPDERKTFSTKRTDYAMGGLVGIVKFTDVLTRSASRWFVGPYGWHFERAMSVNFVPLKGQLGLFDAHPEIAKLVRRELESRVSA